MDHRASARTPKQEKRRQHNHEDRGGVFTNRCLEEGRCYVCGIPAKTNSPVLCRFDVCFAATTPLIFFSDVLRSLVAFRAM